MVMVMMMMMLIVVFPNVPAAPGQPCTGEDRKYFFYVFFARFKLTFSRNLQSNINHNTAVVHVEL